MDNDTSTRTHGRFVLLMLTSHLNCYTITPPLFPVVIAVPVGRLEWRGNNEGRVILDKNSVFSLSVTIIYGT